MIIIIIKWRAGAGGGTVFLRAGTFYINHTVQITHSGLSIAAYQNEEVVVSGGVALTPTWTKASSNTTLGIDTYAHPYPCIRVTG